MVRGACLCGDLAFEAEGPFELMHHCHCSMCRKASGASFSTLVASPVAGFRWLSGDGKAAGRRTSAEIVRTFCPRCGSPVPGSAYDHRLFFPTGLLEGDLDARADCHMFAASRAPWVDIPAGHSAFDAYPPGVPAPEVAPREHAEPVAGKLRGSCLCDGVRFLVDDAAVTMWHCHCSRCRRAHAAAFASNLFIEPGALRFTRGEDRVRRYKAPEADRFAHSFCGGCGGSVPHVVPAIDKALVPMGALDDAPSLRPQSHIFVASKAPWFEIWDDLPRYDAYPPGWPPSSPRRDS